MLQRPIDSHAGMWDQERGATSGASPRGCSHVGMQESEGGGQIFGAGNGRKPRILQHQWGHSVGDSGT
jgi:hypothetical protein